MRLLRLLAAGIATLLLSLPLTASAQDATPSAPLPQEQLDGLLAPIALYPDQLLTQVLIASTYPLEVVEAARFVKANPTLRGQALDDALRDRTWDASVLSLAAFPQVLDMMDAHLEWTQRLGDAFLADEAAVMRTVQALRQRAEQAGNLRSTEQQTVVVQDRNIIIEPAQPEYVYVPVYNPTVIYGPWWAPDYRPWYWYPPPIWGYAPAPSWWGYTAGFSWGAAWAIGYNNWGWARPNWYSHRVNINVGNNYWLNRPQYRARYPGGGGNWSHAPEHRRGVAYRDPGTSNRYRPTNPGAIQSRESYRGRDAMPGMREVPGASPGQGATRPSAPPATERSATRPMPGSPGQPGMRPSAPPTTEGPATRPMPSAPSGQPATRPTAPSTTESATTRPIPSAPFGQPAPRPNAPSTTESPTTRPMPSAPSGQPAVRPVPSQPPNPPAMRPIPSQPPNPPAMRPIPSQPPSQPATRPMPSQPTMRPAPSQPPTQPAMRPMPSAPPSQPAMQTAPTFQTQPRSQVQMESNRGQMSRQTMNAPQPSDGRPPAPAGGAAPQTRSR